MDIKKIFTWLPIALALIGSLYTGINVISKLNNTIEQHTLQLQEVSSTLSSIDKRFTIEIKNLNQKYTDGREEIFREITYLTTEIKTARAKVEALDNAYYKVNDEVRDLGYDLKDFKREVTGDY
jgi:chromosome segregation ATPase|tara:strand:- start:156 stop:527 length:372 start_codon:yes stop_codon:yes gene_type:complete